MSPSFAPCSKEEFEVSYAPTFTKKLQNQEAILGSMAKFVVKAIGEPVPSIKWSVILHHSLILIL